MSMQRAMTLAGAVLATVLGFTATAPVHAQAQNAGRNLNIAAVNLDNKNVLRINFPPSPGTPSDFIGNTDQSTFVRPEALAFVTNATTFQLDLLIADNQRGTLYRYPGALTVQTPPNPTAATLVWNSNTQGAGPTAPDALAVDGLGNLMVANSTSGHSANAQLWEFPVGASGAGSFGAPVLLDSNFQNKETLLEVAFAPTDVAGATGVSGGDLLLLTTSRVLAYSRASGFTSRITLLSFPNGSPVAGGMDFWPIGNGAAANYSLLISSSGSSSISRYYFTNPLTPAPVFATGLTSPFRLKTLFQAGDPLLFVSESGAVLEFGANPANGSGVLQASLMQNITTPQGFAVSNDFTNAASVCLQAGGCNLTGLLGHTVSSNITTLNGDIVEDVCTVNADPRVTFAGGAWSCSVPFTPPAGFTCPPGTPANGPGCLPVNAMCPGFDDTGKMALPDTLCGRSGKTGAGFSIIKTLVTPTQFVGGLVENSALLSDGTNPECGPNTLADPNAADGAFLFAPLKAEGTIQEGANAVDMTDGCGTVHSSGGHMSIYIVGPSVNEAAPELNPAGGLRHPLENFAQIKYQNLTSTVTGWTNAFNNISAPVSGALWAGNVPPASGNQPFGCLDKSWALFYAATVLDADGSPQARADLQNAANLLTDADSIGNSTCDAIAVANPNAFSQTPNATFPNAPTVLNPFGEFRGRDANLYYSIDVRLLGNAAPNHWPLPVSVNVSPTAVTLPSANSPGSATLFWNVHGASGCTLSSSDGVYAGATLASPQSLTIPVADSGTIVAYTITCGSGPAGNAANAVTAYVTVFPPPTASVSPAAIVQGASSTLSWNTSTAQGCSGSSNDPSAAGFFNNVALNGSGSHSVTPTAAGSFTYTLACTSPATSVSATLTVVAPPTLTASPSTVTLGAPSPSNSATLTWNENGNTGCTWSSSDAGFTAPAGASGTQTVTPQSVGTASYTLACSTPGPTSQTVSVTVQAQPPLISVAPSSIILGYPATLQWTEYPGDVCTPSSSGTDTNAADRFSGPIAMSGSMPLTPNATGTNTYTLTCTVPAVTRSATLTVNPPPTVSVTPAALVQGASSTLSWNTSTAQGCSGSSNDPSAAAFNGALTGTGSSSVTPAAGSFTYTLACTGPATSVSATLTVVPAPTLGISPATITLPGSATLTWNENGNTGCSWSSSDAGFTAPAGASGTQAVTPQSVGTASYTLACTTPGPTSKTVSVTVQAQAPLISVSPSSITLGDSATLQWTQYSGDVCTAGSSGTDTNAADRFSGPITMNGSMVLTPNATGNDTYTLTCTVPAVTRSATLTVNPSPAIIKIAVVHSGSEIEVPDRVTLTWTISGGPATGCQVSGQWPSGAVPQFIPFPVFASGTKSLTYATPGTYTYTLSCTSPATPAKTSVYVERRDD
ncbi:MAG: hypothetical protein JSR67_06925 [Proteobacteria bacterium]|nr:hypothetical protein [Pseudomonadota bacterium]